METQKPQPKQFLEVLKECVDTLKMYLPNKIGDGSNNGELLKKVTDALNNISDSELMESLNRKLVNSKEFNERGWSIALTEEKAIEVFYNALCNGIPYISSYGLELDYEQEDYVQAKLDLKNKELETPSDTICYEDVFIQMLRNGKSLTLKDVENDGEYTRQVSLQDVINRVPLTPQSHLMDMLQENDDATTADVILQTVFFEDVIFG